MKPHATSLRHLPAQLARPHRTAANVRTKQQYAAKVTLASAKKIVASNAAGALAKLAKLVHAGLAVAAGDAPADGKFSVFVTFGPRDELERNAERAAAADESLLPAAWAPGAGPHGNPYWLRPSPAKDEDMLLVMVYRPDEFTSKDFALHLAYVATPDSIRIEGEAVCTQLGVGLEPRCKGGYMGASRAPRVGVPTTLG